MKRCTYCARVVDDDTATHCAADGAPLQPVIDPMIERRLGHYRIRRRLGSGGMSTVYLADHTLLGTQVALKILRQDLTQDPLQRSRFTNEAKAIRRIQHPNIVELLDFDGGTEGPFYLVMEYIAGESLHRRIQRGPLPSSEALGLVRQIASALGRAHELGVIHRDLKPENVLIARDAQGVERVKVVDFGIAKVAGADPLTGSLQIIGTPGYIAPEYIRANAIDGRADLYSLGVVLYEMVTGRAPYDYRDQGEMLMKPLRDPPIPPRERRPEVEPAVEALILRAIQREPAQRFRDAYHMREAIDEVAARLPRASVRIDVRLPAVPAPVPAPTLAGAPLPAGSGEVARAVEVAPSETPFRGVSAFEGAATESTGPAELTAAAEAVTRARARVEGAQAAPASTDEQRGLIARLAQAVESAQRHAGAVTALRRGLFEVKARFGERADGIAAEVSRLAGRSEVLAERRKALRQGSAAPERPTELLEVERDLVQVQRRREAALRQLAATMEALDAEVEARSVELRVALAGLEEAMRRVEAAQASLDAIFPA